MRAGHLLSCTHAYGHAKEKGITPISRVVLPALMSKKANSACTESRVVTEKVLLVGTSMEVGGFCAFYFVARGPEILDVSPRGLGMQGKNTICMQRIVHAP